MNDPLDQLLSKAKREQDRIASLAEVGVETRLRGRLERHPGLISDLGVEALGRLCSGAAVMALCLAIWVLFSPDAHQEISSLIIEQWVLGI